MTPKKKKAATAPKKGAGRGKKAKVAEAEQNVDITDAQEPESQPEIESQTSAAEESHPASAESVEELDVTKTEATPPSDVKEETVVNISVDESEEPSTTDAVKVEAGTEAAVPVDGDAVITEASEAVSEVKVEGAVKEEVDAAITEAENGEDEDAQREISIEEVVEEALPEFGGVTVKFDGTTLQLHGGDLSESVSDFLDFLLSKKDTLQKVHLIGNNFLPHGINGLVVALLQCENLNLVELNDQNLEDFGVGFLCPLITGSKTLKTVSLQKNKIGDEGAQTLGKALASSSSIIAINLAHNEIGDEGAKALGVAFGLRKHILRVDLSANEIGPDGARGLGAGLSKCTSFNTLAIDDNNISGDGAQGLAGGLMKCTSLTYLSLDGNGIGDDGAKSISVALKRCAGLLTLNVGTNLIGAVGTRSLGASLAQCKALSTFKYDNNDIGDDGAAALGEAISNFSALTSLDIETNDIGVEGFTALSAALGRCASLVTLKVGGNDLREGAKHLAAALRNISVLGSVDVSKCCIGDSAARELAAALAKCPSLHSLLASSNDIGNEGFDALCQNLPTSIRTFDISNNKVTVIPPSFLRFSNLETFETSENNWETDVSDIQSLRKSLREKANEVSDGKKTMLRLMLIGPCGSGKSTLQRALASPKLKADPDAPSSDSISIVTKIPEGGRDHLFDHHRDHDIPIWDFSGKDEYTLSQQNFYSELAVYVLVWHAPSESPSGPGGISAARNLLRGWLETLHQNAPGAAVVLVGSHGESSGRQHQSIVAEWAPLIADQALRLIGLFNSDTDSDIQILSSQLAQIESSASAAGTLSDSGDVVAAKMAVIRKRIAALTVEGKPKQIRLFSPKSPLIADFVSGVGMNDVYSFLTDLCVTNQPFDFDPVPASYREILDALFRQWDAVPAAQRPFSWSKAETATAIGADASVADLGENSEEIIWSAVEHWHRMGRVYIVGESVFVDPAPLLRALPILQAGPVPPSNTDMTAEGGDLVAKEFEASGRVPRFYLETMWKDILGAGEISPEVREAQFRNLVDGCVALGLLASVPDSESESEIWIAPGRYPDAASTPPESLGLNARHRLWYSMSRVPPGLFQRIAGVLHHEAHTRSLQVTATKTAISVAKRDASGVMLLVKLQRKQRSSSNRGGDVVAVDGSVEDYVEVPTLVPSQHQEWISIRWTGEAGSPHFIAEEDDILAASTSAVERVLNDVYPQLCGWMTTVSIPKHYIQISQPSKERVDRPHRNNGVSAAVFLGGISKYMGSKSNCWCSAAINAVNAKFNLDQLIGRTSRIVVAGLLRPAEGDAAAGTKRAAEDDWAQKRAYHPQLPGSGAYPPGAYPTMYPPGYAVPCPYGGGLLSATPYMAYQYGQPGAWSPYAAHLQYAQSASPVVPPPPSTSTASSIPPEYSAHAIPPEYSAYATPAAAGHSVLETPGKSTSSSTFSSSSIAAAAQSYAATPKPAYTAPVPMQYTYGHTPQSAYTYAQAPSMYDQSAYAYAQAASYNPYAQAATYPASTQSSYGATYGVAPQPTFATQIKSSAADAIAYAQSSSQYTWQPGKQPSAPTPTPAPSSGPGLIPAPDYSQQSAYAGYSEEDQQQIAAYMQQQDAAQSGYSYAQQPATDASSSQHQQQYTAQGYGQQPQNY